MMVIVPRIVVAPAAGAAPVVRDVRYGIRFRIRPFRALSVRRMGGLIDFLFDNQKDKASEKFWNAGLKVALRANPG